jgi:hypothetical protein
MLHVERGDDVDAGGEQGGDVLPSLAVGATGEVGVGEFVDEYDLRGSGKDGFDVQLLSNVVADRHLPGGDDFEIPDPASGASSAVCLDEPDDHVDTALASSPSLFEHGAGLADTGYSAEIDP